MSSQVRLRPRPSRCSARPASRPPTPPPPPQTEAPLLAPVAQVERSQNVYAFMATYPAREANLPQIVAAIDRALAAPRPGAR